MTEAHPDLDRDQSRDQGHVVGTTHILGSQVLGEGS